ncbi:hypothetical protein SELMODRAFT_405727 [Selaginella moellendorffii]|uniref:COBRA-like protein n=1 Tax=Selaginella moellendorffii TaxID=88036 RepID=D8QZI7_SELML|nr:COBRA-like protein 1 [Selaginella moellendorffii]EFJ34809.1 hypothetical protein SELMODRAFT_405727 [Selaginella moellendorffii]|eukprot:XP_002964476.1 COBRA-like protein 1 [Selaginella moellendorffii]
MGSRLGISAPALLAALILLCDRVQAFDPLDPEGNITLKWDIISWTSDGYQALVSIINYQRYRHIESPGWTLGWTWQGGEVIWGMVGAQATYQGDCSKFHGTIPHCCLQSPTIVDLLPEAPASMKSANCCRNGVLSSLLQDPENSVASFQLTVGQSSNVSDTTSPPKSFLLGAPGPGYECSSPRRVNGSLFFTPDHRRATQALMTWNVTCRYSQAVAQRAPSCCVSYSAFYNATIVPCPTCACQCSYNATQPIQNAQPMCMQMSSAYMNSPGYSTGRTRDPPELYCSTDMCPVKIHWHVKTNYYDYWRAKLTIINRSLRKNHTQWNVVVQHPNLDNLTSAFSFNYMSLPRGRTNDTAMFWGIRYYNDELLTAGPVGNVQSELLFQKDPSFTLDKGWAFPRRVYFNGEECVLPPPHSYPFLPSAAIHRQTLAWKALVLPVLLALIL